MTPLSPEQRTAGLILLVASDAILFGALFFANLLLRASTSAWPHRLLASKPAVAEAVVLFAATILVSRARRAAATGPPIISARRQLTYSAFLAALFLVLRSSDYVSKLNHGIEPASSTLYALYFLLTGFHALHVLGVAAAAGYLAAASARYTRAEIPRFATRVAVLSWAWFFLTLVWFGIVVLFSIL